MHCYFKKEGLRFSFTTSQISWGGKHKKLIKK